MRSDDLAPLLTPPGRPQLGMRQGILLSWDTSTGSNTVQVAGQTFTDLPILASGTLAMAPGDQVALLRFGNSYFILGVIRPAGVGTLAMRAAKVAAEQGTTSSTYTNLATVGPTLTDVYVGRSRQCLVFLRASAGVTDGVAAMDVAVTGASSISAGTAATSAAFVGAPTAGQLICSIASTTLLTAADGLNEGLNTFTAKYAKTQGAAGNALFADRTIIVFPL